MANNKRTVKITVDNNLAEVVAATEQLNKNLKEAVANSKKLGSNLGTSPSRTGSRAADAALGVSGGVGGTIGLNRGSSGAGGRGGERDFARQAQGLGGLVHVYAAFAANIYAVTAAFSALSKAADVDNMVKSADALSARYGVALGSVATQLKQVTGLAISTEEALQFTNLGASAGLTGQQMKDLAAGATGASKALGRDLNDSMQRIFRGTIKLEPELLDELGIMVRLDDATESYARTLGKTSTQLTEAERRSAFLVAVTEQVNSKFKDASDAAAANGYTQLLATMKETQQSGLSLVNTVLEPIAKILASSPMALIGIVTILAAKLAKLTMPNLVPDAEKKLAATTVALEESGKRLKTSRDALMKTIENSPANKFISMDTSSSRVKEVAKLSNDLRDKLERDIASTPSGKPMKLSIDTEHVRAQLVKAIESAQKVAVATLNRSNLSEGSRDAWTQRAASLAIQLEMVKSLEKGVDNIATIEGRTADDQLSHQRNIREATKADTAHKVSLLQAEGHYVDAIKTAWGETRAAQKASNQELGKAPGMLTKTAQFTSALGTASQAAGAGLIALVGRLGTYGAIIAMVAGSLEALLRSKAVGALTDAFSQIDVKAQSVLDNVKALAKAQEQLKNSKSLSDIFDFNVSSLKLAMEAINDLKGLSKERKDAMTKGTFLDKFIDAFKDVTIGLEGSLDKLSESFGKVASTTLGSTTEGNTDLRARTIEVLRHQGTGRLRSSVSASKFNDTGTAELLEQLRYRAGAGDKEAAKLVKEITKELDAFAKTAKNTQEILSGMRENVRKVGTATKDFINKLVTTTPLTEVFNGLNALQLGVGITVKGTTEAFQALDRNVLLLAGNIDATTTSTIMAIKAEHDSTSAKLKSGELSEKEAEKRLASIYKEKDAVTVFGAVVNSVSTQVIGLATQSQAAELRMAKLAASLRKLNAFTSIFGGSTALTEKRQRIEAAQGAEEVAALRNQKALITRMFEAAAAPARAAVMPSTSKSSNPLDLITNIQESIKLLQGQRGTDKSAAANEHINNLIQERINMAKTLTDLAIAQSNLETQIAIKLVQQKSAQEKAMELYQAANAEASENREKEDKDGARAIALLDRRRDAVSAISEEYGQLVTAQQASLRAEKEVQGLEVARKKALDEYNNITANNLKPKSKEELEQYNKRVAEAAKAFNQADEDFASGKRRENATKSTQGLAEELSKLTMEQTKLNILKETYQLSQSMSVQGATEQLKVQKLLNNAEAEYERLALSVLETKMQEKQTIIDTSTGEENAANRAAAEYELAKLTLQLEKQKLEIKEAQWQRAKNTVSNEIRAAEQTGKFGLDYVSNSFTLMGLKMAETQSKAVSVGEKMGDSLVSAFDSIGDKFAELAQTGELTWKTMGDFVRSTFSDVFRDLAAEYMKLAIRTAMLGTGGTDSAGNKIFGGILGALFKGLGGGGASSAILPDILDEGSTKLIGNTDADIINSAVSGSINANGNIISPYGPLKLHKYEKGGIASSPHVAIFGEGRQNEAFVPLPDNRTIPVTLTGNQGGGVTVGDTHITVNVDSSGNANTSSNNAEMAKVLSMTIKNTVQTEFMKQTRPGGLLYRGR